MILDMIGVCKSAAEVMELTAKSTGKLLKKREVTLVDSSGGAVSIQNNYKSLLMNIILL